MFHRKTKPRCRLGSIPNRPNSYFLVESFGGVSVRYMCPCQRNRGLADCYEGIYLAWLWGGGAATFVNLSDRRVNTEPPNINNFYQHKSAAFDTFIEKIQLNAPFSLVARLNQGKIYVFKNWLEFYSASTLQLWLIDLRSWIDFASD